jgi:uncharacterized protein affecting Mg2+/Co2+ transport
VTEGIRIGSRRASRQHSEPMRWFFLYTIRISNEGSEVVQLISHIG